MVLHGEVLLLNGRFSSSKIKKIFCLSVCLFLAINNISFEISDMKQCAEYKGQLGTTEYGHFLIDLATKYNDALLVVENNQFLDQLFLHPQPLK